MSRRYRYCTWQYTFLRTVSHQPVIDEPLVSSNGIQWNSTSERQGLPQYSPFIVDGLEVLCCRANCRLVTLIKRAWHPAQDDIIVCAVANVLCDQDIFGRSEPPSVGTLIVFVRGELPIAVARMYRIALPRKVVKSAIWPPHQPSMRTVVNGVRCRYMLWLRHGHRMNDWAPGTCSLLSIA